MNQNTEKADNNKLDAWIKEKTKDSVYKFIDKYKIDSSTIEAKAAWVLPFQILIGKIRVTAKSHDFNWFICGEVPNDYLDSGVASTPREAARHFSLKWQLTASKYEDKGMEQQQTITSSKEVTDNLINQSQALYDVVADERLWPELKEK